MIAFFAVITVARRHLGDTDPDNEADGPEDDVDADQDPY